MHEPLAHCRNVVSLTLFLPMFHSFPIISGATPGRKELSLFYRYYFRRCSSELAQLVPLLFLEGESTHYSDRLHDFSVTVPKY